jgi:hypothetical protein
MDRRQFLTIGRLDYHSDHCMQLRGRLRAEFGSVCELQSSIRTGQEIWGSGSRAKAAICLQSMCSRIMN